MFTGVVLVVVTVTRSGHGAYLVVIAAPLLFAMMLGVRRPYESNTPGLAE